MKLELALVSALKFIKAPVYYMIVGDDMRVQLPQSSNYQFHKINSELDSSHLNCLIINLNSTLQFELIDKHLAESPPCIVLVLDARNPKRCSKVLIQLESRGYYVRDARDSFYLLTRRSIPIDTHLNLAISEFSNVLAEIAPGTKNKLDRLKTESPPALYTVDPLVYLVSERFDIALKLAYARLYKANIISKKAILAYYYSVKFATGNRFLIKERDGTGKKSFSSFLASFNMLLDAPCENLPPILSTNKNHVLDGSHRIVRHLLEGKTMSVIKIDSNANGALDYLAFQKSRLFRPKTPQSILDFGALQYPITRPDLNIIIIYPISGPIKKLLPSIRNKSTIFYSKKLWVSRKNSSKLISSIYADNAWFTSSSDSANLLNKIRGCFPFPGYIRVYLVHFPTTEDARRLKNEVRALAKVGNHSIHITDGESDTLALSRQFFHQNTISMLQHLSPTKSSIEFLNTFQEWLLANQMDPDQFLVDGSILLALLGLREAKDLDFLYVGRPTELTSLPKNINCHNDESLYHSASSTKMIRDPSKYFYFQGLKIITPLQLLIFKFNRLQPKDIPDILYLLPVVSGDAIYLLLRPILRLLPLQTITMLPFRLLWTLKRRLRNYKHYLSGGFRW